MKQIVDKLNKIAKKIDESVEIPQTDLIIDSLDAITKAYGGTPNDSNLIVDKLEDIYNNISPAVSGNIEITENGENINVAPYATATVNVSGGGGGDFSTATVTITNTTEENYYVPIPIATEREGMLPAMINNGITVETGTSATVVVPLYHNACYVRVYDSAFSFASSTGDISIMGGTQVLIQGDGTLTI